MGRIYWDDEDRAKLARETTRIIRENGLGTLSAFQQAQSVLKPEKRRKIPSLAAVTWLSGEMEKQKRVVDAEQIRQAELDAAREEGARQARENMTPGTLWPMLHTHLVTAGSGLIKDMLLTVLRDPEVAQAIGSAFSQQSQPVTVPADLAMPSSGQSKRSATQAVTRLAKVVILGLLPGQVAEIKREFNSRFNLEFVEADSSHTQLRQHAQNAQFIFGMRFINHSDEHQVTAVARDRYIRIEGGLTRLREALTHVHEHQRLPVHGFRQSSMAH